MSPKLIAGLIAALALSAPVCAQDVATTALLAKLKSAYPNTTFSRVKPTPVDGVYEVVMGKNTAYVDSSSRYFFFGHLYDMQEQKDLTEDQPTPQLPEGKDFSKLPLSDAIKIVKGNGSRTFAVFSDPDCPYCKKLEQELKSMTDYTLYVFLMPLSGLHPDAPKKAEDMWCSKDKARAWLDYMNKGTSPVSAKCANPISKNLALAESLGIRGTPTLIAKSGKVMPGYAPADRLDAFLNAEGK